MKRITDTAELAELNGKALEFERQRRAFFRRRSQIALPEALEGVGTFCDSFNRLPTILRLYLRCGLSRVDTLTLLGEYWEDCDNVGRHADALRVVLPDGSAPEMMTAPELAALAALPEQVTVYRGADRGVNEAGLCWSTDRAVAAKFPFLLRYHASDPVLVTATVSRDRIIAVKLGRNESEVITKDAIVLSVDALPAGGDPVE